MNRKSFGILAGAFALAGLAGFGQTTQSLAVKSANEIQATNQRKSRREKLPFVSAAGGPMKFSKPFGLTPKDYGQQFGHGNKKGRSNRLRYSHNAKLKRRINNA